MEDVAILPRPGRARRKRAGLHPFVQKYWAFLSYSHDDSAEADWLHKALEEYRVPRTLVGRDSASGLIPSTLSPVFRDRHELAASGDLGEHIREALAGSRFLIVLCSPAAAQSRWTNEEIRQFKALRPDGELLAAIVGGEPWAADVPGHEAEECFPPALKVRYDARGRPTGDRAEPIAADLRASRDGKRLGFLKIVAGMLNVGLDDLVQRDAQRRHRRLVAISVASLLGMLVAIILAVTAVLARDEARDQRREAEGLVGFMLGDLRQKLEPIGRLDALDAVGARTLQYFERQDKSALSDEALAQRARALTMMGEIASTRGDLDGALARYSEAFASTAEALRRYPQDPQRIFDHAQNVFWVGSIDWQRGRTEEAGQRFAEYKQLAQRLVATDPRRPEWIQENLYADTNLGLLLIEQGRFREASGALRNSLQASETLLAAQPRRRDFQDHLMEALAWLSQAEESSGALDEALALRERQLAVMEEVAGERPDAPMKRKMMAAHRAIGRLFAQRADRAEGLRHLQRAAALADDLTRLEPENTEWAEDRSSILLDLGELEVATDRRAEAGEHARAGCSIAERLAAKDNSVAAWRGPLQLRCLELRARLALAGDAPGEARLLAARGVAIAEREAAAGDRASRMDLSNAYLLRARVEQEAGERDSALAAYRRALTAIPVGIELTPHQMARQGLILRGLGQRDEARRIEEKLDAIGYRHPAYLAALRQ